MLATIEDTREKLYKALVTLGPGWHDRLSLARQIGKKTLNPVDIIALDTLTADGRIEKVSQQLPITGRGGNFTRYVYRVKE